MAFTDAIAFLRDYRTDRQKALNNEQRMKWSTTPYSKFADLVEVFDSTKANGEWEHLYDNAGDYRKLQAERWKIAFLAGCRRDVRIQFAAWDDDRMRVPVDQDRYEYMRLAFNQRKTDYFEQAVAGKEDVDG